MKCIMSRFFGTRRDGAKNETGSVSSAKLPMDQAVQSDKVATHTLLDSLSILSKASGMGVVQHDARLAVVGELLVSVLTHLPVAMRAEIGESFRDRIEDVMSLNDDRSLSKQYHSALLNEVNFYLNVGR
jgi:hypothetical protein